MLGRECYKVVIDSLICGDAELFRPHRNLNYIRDAIGHCIAWPSQLVCSFLGFFILLLSLHSKSKMVNINLKG
jgi:hypothetical protein